MNDRISVGGKTALISYSGVFSPGVTYDPMGVTLDFNGILVGDRSQKVSRNEISAIKTALEAELERDAIPARVLLDTKDSIRIKPPLPTERIEGKWAGVQKDANEWRGVVTTVCQRLESLIPDSAALQNRISAMPPQVG